MGALLGLLLAAVVLGLAVAYWYISVPLLAVGFAWMVVKRRDARQRAAITAATTAAIPPTPNRIAGPVWWQFGTLELTSDQLVVTLVGTTGRVLQPVPFRRATALPLARLLRVEKTTTTEGENLTFRFKGGGAYGYQGCRGGEAIMRLLDALASRVPVVENGLRWPAPRVVHRRAAARVAPVALRCPACGAPAPQGTARCIYCRAALAHG